MGGSIRPGPHRRRGGDSPRRESHHGLRHRNARGGDRAHEFEWIERALAVKAIVERRAFDLNEVIDRHGLRIRVEVGKLRDQACAFAARFPHPDDTAAAHGNAGRADTRERIEAILIDARRHDLAVELGRGVEIVIVVIEAGVLQCFDAFFGEADP